MPAVALLQDADPYAALIGDLAGMRTRVVAVEDEPFPADVGVLFLPEARPEFVCRARAVTGVPVLTGQDTTAIALAAVLLTTLSRAGRTPRSSQVVIAGADALPVLCPLLMVSGIGSVTTWNPADAQAFPLRRVAEGADAVIDLLTTAAGMADVVTVIAPDRARDPLLALPGLLRAMARRPDARLDVEVHHACALALVMATPPDDLRPHGPDRALTDRIADAATTALRESADRP